MILDQHLTYLLFIVYSLVSTNYGKCSLKYGVWGRGEDKSGIIYQRN